jgi:hypothetical protein
MATQNPPREGSISPSVRRLEPTLERAEYARHVFSKRLGGVTARGELCLC